MNLYLDTETCGLCGPAIIVQYAYDDGPVTIWNFWTNPIKESIALIEEFVKHDLIGFNLAFDVFQIAKIYTMFDRYHDKEAYPEDIIDELAIVEPKARDGPCLKFKSSLDLMLHARKGEFQSTMARRDIKIRKVPRLLANRLADKLAEDIELDGIYFARQKNKYAPRWEVKHIEGNPDFCDVVLKFKASSSLKALTTFALKKKEVVHFDEIEVNKKLFPLEIGWAPFALALSNRAKNWRCKIKRRGQWVEGYAWPGVIKHHIKHWEYNEPARKYASDDVINTRELYHYFGRPEHGDDDSELASMVAVCRWRGYTINQEGIKQLKALSIRKAAEFPIAPRAALKYITQGLSETELMVINASTKKVLLEELANASFPCAGCNAKGCILCDRGYIKHPAAERAKNVLDARSAKKEIELYDKLLQADRFHASFVVIGTLSSRMAGTDGLNPQGIKKVKYVRDKFPLAHINEKLLGGDFSGFEVVLADAVYNDPDLRKDLLSGKKIHALFGVHVYPNMTYEEIVASSGTSDDKYTRCKSAVFAMLYGGEGYTLQTRLGVDRETADKAYELFTRKYKGVGIARRSVSDKFCTMQQAGGIGTRITWREPDDYIESLFGFRRYFTLEHKITKALFQLAEHPPKEWKEVKVKVVRRDREQTASGAVQSSLFGAAFGLQSSNMRAAANHVIQSSGAQITKRVQRKIWDIQPAGIISSWRVQPANVHDEILCPTDPNYTEIVNKVVKDTVETFRDKVPLIAMEWGPMETWASK